MWRRNIHHSCLMMKLASECLCVDTQSNRNKATFCMSKCNLICTHGYRSIDAYTLCTSAHTFLPRYWIMMMLLCSPNKIIYACPPNHHFHLRFSCLASRVSLHFPFPFCPCLSGSLLLVRSIKYNKHNIFNTDMLIYVCGVDLGKKTVMGDDPKHWKMMERIQVSDDLNWWVWCKSA